MQAVVDSPSEAVVFPVTKQMASIADCLAKLNAAQEEQESNS